MMNLGLYQRANERMREQVDLYDTTPWWRWLRRAQLKREIDHLLMTQLFMLRDGKEPAE